MVLNDGNLQAGSFNTKDGSSDIFFKTALNSKFLNIVEHPVDRILVGLDDVRELTLFDLSKQNTIMRKSTDDDLELNCLSIHPDGKLAAIGGSGNNLHFYDLTSNQIVLTLESVCVTFIL